MIMTFEEYQLNGRVKYAAFVEAVRNILVALVDAYGLVPHAITGRAKDPVSLKKKLALNNIDPESAIDEALKDLAGCRIVFLTNSQVDQFRGTGAIHENFDVISINEHHAVPGTATEKRLFDSTNYFVQLKPDRAALPEYQRFAGLRIEIQVQTLLNHAWAEMGHDTIYKEPKLQHVDKRHMDEINERMKKVMRDHLLPASHDFDKIARDFDRIIRADAAVDETMTTIANSTSNDELLGAFETADTLILPFIADGRDVFVKLVPQIASAVERVRGTQSAPIDSIFGEFPGKTGEIVARRAADLIGRGIYADLKLTFDTLVRLYAGAASNAERKIWADLGARFAAYDLDAWRRLRGPGIQQSIVDGIGGLGDDERKAAHGLVNAMIAKILSCEISGMERGSLNTILLHNGTVSAGDPLRKVRSAAIDILERLLDEAEDDAAREVVLAALWTAATPPFQGGSEALRTQVMEDAARVAAIVRNRAASWSLELRRQTEVKAQRVHRNFRAVPDAMAGNEALVAAQQALILILLDLRDALNGDKEFALYKAIAGRDSVAPAAWDEASFDHRAKATWRTQRIGEIAAQADAGQADEWLARVRNYLTLVTGGADRSPIAEFVGALAERQPGIGAHFLYQMDHDLRPVLVRLLHGLEAAGEGDLVRQHFARFVGEGRFLADLADWLGRRTINDIDLLMTVADRARELGEPDAILEAINAAGRLYQRAPDPHLIDQVFLPAVDYFRAANAADWIDRAIGLLEGTMVAALDEAQSRTLIQSFVAIPDIDYDADRVLAVVAGRFPGLILEFFEMRVTRDRKGDSHRFEPVPFDIHDLRDVLSKDPRRLLAATREWYRHDTHFHAYRGGRLVGNVFPEFDDDFVEALREMIAKGDRDDLAFVLETLAAYDGSESIFALCMDVVDRLELGDELLGRVSGVLGERGVLSGEFGSVEADRAEHEHLAQWLEDPRDKVQAFVRNERRRIEQSMAWEQRRAERDVEQMKRDWGEPEVPDR